MSVQKLEKWSVSGRPLRKDLQYPPYPEKMQTTLPGDVHLVLMASGVIKDPYVRDQFRDCSWIGETQWIWSTEFSCDVRPRNRIFLNLEGLTYVAEVFLNGKKIAEHKNMHRLLRVEITGLVRENNQLDVFLLPFDDAIRDTPEISCFTQWAGAVYDPELCRKRTAGRKADYTYGWDWTQGLPVCGIEGDAYLEIYDSCLIRDAVIHTRNDGHVRLNCGIESAYRELHAGTAVLQVISAQNGRSAAESRVPVVVGPGTENYEFSLCCKQPQLWYPAGYGAQATYQCKLTLELDGETVEKTIPFAFREVEIADHAFTPMQGEYRIVVNGKKIYAQGANWIPPEQIPARAGDERYTRLIALAREAGINYFRFWGGGIYERELFYTLCDEAGIMIWHDFMLSGPEVPEFDPAFRREFNAEAEYQFKRLCNHPSIVVWCGGNELDTFHAALGDLPPQAPHPNGHYYGYRLIYEDVPAMIRKIRPETQYVPTCPTAGKAAPEGTKINHYGFGTCHRNLLHQFAADAEFDAQSVPAFWNEFYGFSPCAESSILKFLAPEDLDKYNTPVMQDHSVLETQRNNEWMRFFQNLSWHHAAYGRELPFPEICELFKEAHCELLKRYLEFMRRNLKFSGGYGYWMFNSAFPMFDLSLADYYLTPKAVFYAFKRAARPLLPVAAVYEDHVDGYLSAVGNGLPETVKYTASVMTFAGTVLLRQSRQIAVAPEESPLVIRLELPPDLPKEDAFVLVCAEPENGPAICNHRFFVPKRCRKMPNAELAIGRSSTAVTLTAPAFAADVEIFPCDGGIYPEDSRFDMMPGETRTIRFSQVVDPASIRVVWSNCTRHVYPVQMSGNTAVLYNPSTVTEFVQNEEIAPLETKAVRWSPEIGFGSIRRETLLKFDSRIGNEVIHCCKLLQPFPELQNGVLRVCNRGAEVLTVPQIRYCGVLRDGKPFAQTSPATHVPPGKSYEYDFSLPADLLPVGTSVEWDKTAYPRFLDPTRPFTERDFEDLPSRPFDGETMLLEESPEPNPYFLKQGVRFVYGESSAKIYLTSHGEVITAFFFLRNVPYCQEFCGESVYKESCIEFAIADGEEYRDYSLAGTPMGCEVFLRRGSKPFEPGNRQGREAHLEMAYFPASRSLACRLTLDCRAAGFSHLMQSESFKLLINFREPGKSTFVFSGKELLYPQFYGGKVRKDH